MENPHAERQNVLLQRITKNAVSTRNREKKHLAMLNLHLHQ